MPVLAGGTRKREHHTGNLLLLVAALAVVLCAAGGGRRLLCAGAGGAGARRPSFQAAATALRLPAYLPMANDQPPLLRRPIVLLFGDSLTERSLDPEGGWGAAVAHYFARKADVVNRGFGGYNSRWALPALDQVLSQVAAAKQEVLLATLWLGANDAAVPGRGATRQHVPVADYAANLEAMVAKMRSAGVPRVVLITPPPVHDEARVRHQQQRMGSTAPVDPDRTNEFTAQYADAVRALAAKAGVPLLDLNNALQEVEGWRTDLLVDGLHFTPAGQAAVGRLLIELLQRTYPELSLDKLPNQFPWWDKYADAGPTKDRELWDAFVAATEKKDHSHSHPADSGTPKKQQQQQAGGAPKAGASAAPQQQQQGAQKREQDKAGGG